MAMQVKKTYLIGLFLAGLMNLAHAGPIMTTTSFSSSANSSTSGNPVTFVVSTQPATGLFLTTESFTLVLYGPTVVNMTATSLISSPGTASFVVNGLQPGSYSVTASFNGDSLYSASSATGTQGVVLSSATMVVEPCAALGLGTGGLMLLLCRPGRNRRASSAKRAGRAMAVA